MKKITKDIEEKISQILSVYGGEPMLTNEEATEQLLTLFKQEWLRMIGEDEKPEDYQPKSLTENEISIATDAVKFHARNQLRQQMRKKVEKK